MISRLQKYETIILLLRETPLTFAAIARCHTPQITRERVRQIAKLAEAEGIKIPPRLVGRPKKILA